MRIALLWLVALSLGLLAAAPPADAHGRGRVRFGVIVGGPWFWPGYAWPHYYGYRERVVVERRGPTVYVEREADGAQRAPEDYWYYCPDSKTYYPYVKECESPWHRVAPQPQD